MRLVRLDDYFNVNLNLMPALYPTKVKKFWGVSKNTRSLHNTRNWSKLCYFCRDFYVIYTIIYDRDVFPAIRVTFMNRMKLRPFFLNYYVNCKLFGHSRSFGCFTIVPICWIVVPYGQITMRITTVYDIFFYIIDARFP